MISFGPFKIRFLADGEILFREGEESNFLYLIKAGSIRVYTLDDLGAKVELGILATNQMVGELAFIDHSPRSAWAEAVGKVELLEIPTESLQDMLQRQPPWVRALLESLATRLRNSKEKMQAMNEKFLREKGAV